MMNVTNNTNVVDINEIVHTLVVVDEISDGKNLIVAFEHPTAKHLVIELTVDDNYDHTYNLCYATTD